MTKKAIFHTPALHRQPPTMLRSILYPPSSQNPTQRALGPLKEYRQPNPPRYDAQKKGRRKQQSLSQPWVSVYVLPRSLILHKTPPKHAHLAYPSMTC